VVGIFVAALQPVFGNDARTGAKPLVGPKRHAFPGAAVDHLFDLAVVDQPAAHRPVAAAP